MNLHFILPTNITFRQKIIHIPTLITLQLHNLTQLLIRQYSTVRTVRLLQCFEYLAQVEVVGEALDGCERLATVTLLDADVDVGGRLACFDGGGGGVERCYGVAVSVGEVICAERQTEGEAGKG